MSFAAAYTVMSLCVRKSSLEMVRPSSCFCQVLGLIRCFRDKELETFFNSNIVYRYVRYSPG